MYFKTFRSILGILLLLLIYVECKNIIIEEETKNVNETKLLVSCKYKCWNSGECIVVSSSQFCSCKEGTSGDLCEVVDDCSKENFCGQTDDANCMYDGSKGGVCICKGTSKSFHSTAKECRIPCKDNCENDGECVAVGSFQFCSCKEGTSGDLCEMIDECSKENFCGLNNDANCVYDGSKGGTCVCKDTLKYFNSTAKECRSKCNNRNKPCLNGGQCIGTDAGENSNTFCKCKSGTSGDFCETVKGCDTIDCGPYKDAVCAYDGISEGYCMCRTRLIRYSFDPVEKECRKYCDNDKPCHNGGECIKTATGIHGKGFCKCKSGTSDDLCDTVNDCDDQKVDCGYQAGVECTYDGIGGGYCKCYESVHSFDHVEKMCRSRCLQKCGDNPNTICTGNLTSDADIICGCKTATMLYLNSTRLCVDRCSLKCGNNLNVICRGNLETDEDTICDCENSTMVYFETTQTCESPTPCIPNPCKNDGVCYAEGAKAKCTCKNGYSGEMCEIAPAPCIPNPCKNDGVCYVEGAKAKCICKNGYSGEMCEIDPCSANPCKNGGRCYVDHDAANCYCRPPFSGEFCETGPCSSNPCKNRGFCYVDHNVANCICKAPFSGEFCETDPCSPNPCQNGGSCTLEANVFKCVCKERFSGTTCENESKWMLAVALAIAVLLCLLLVCAACIGFVINRNLKIIARGCRDYKA